MSGTETKNICLVAITRMGDMLQASPTITALKQDYPKSRITVVIEKQFAAICDGIPGIDEVFVIDLGMVYRCLMRDYHDIVEAYGYIDRIIKDLRAHNFDFCVNMSSSGYTALLLKMLDIKDSRGWVSDEEGNRLISNPWAMLFAAYVFHANRDYNSINIVDSFRCSSGVKSFPKKLMYNPTAADREYIRKFLAENNLASGGPVICVQVGASQAKRQWSPMYFAALTKYLVEELNARVVYTGSKSEQAIINMVINNYNSPWAISAAGRTNLGQLGALLEEAKVLVTGDTGTMHMAVSVGTPVVALFVASAYCYETGPFSEGNIILEPRISCYPCNPNFICARPDCHQQIPPELVRDMVKLRLLHNGDALLNMVVDSSVADPREVAIKVSYLDEDGFLDFKSINGMAEKEGVEEELFEAARKAYRALWKDDFGAISPEIIWGRITLRGDGTDLVPGLKELIQVAKDGQVIVAKLVNLINDPKGDPLELAKISQSLEAIDRDIEKIGLVFSMLGALSRMFVMEKQNLRGSDPLRLAEDTKQMYSQLQIRAEKFGRLFAYYYKTLRGLQ